VKTIVVGLGNPVLGDDGLGWRVIEEVQRAFDVSARAPASIEFECLALGGLSLMENLIGYDRAILVDSIDLPDTETGVVRVFTLDALPNLDSGHLSSTHDTTLQKALQVGRSLGAHLPQEIVVISVQSPNVYEFSEELSPAVSASIPEAVRLVMEQINPTAHPIVQVHVEKSR
jgi:hydrogenase maturation protease